MAARAMLLSEVKLTSGFPDTPTGQIFASEILISEKFAWNRESDEA